MAVPFQDIKYSDVAQQGQGEKDTYARRFGYAGWKELEAAGGAGLAGGGGGNIEDILARQKQEQAGILAGQRAEEEGLFKQFETMRAGQEQLPALYSRLTETAGIPALQTQLTTARTEVSKVRDLLDRLEEDISSRTQGFLVSEAQRRRSLAAEEAPLRTQLGRLLTGQEVAAGQVASAQAERGTQFQVTQAQQERELEPTKLRISAFSDRAARELTAYTQTRQNELTVLLQKMETEAALTRDELNRASQLAQQEAQFEQQKELIRVQMESDIEQKIRTKGIGETGTTGLSTDLASILRGGGATTQATGDESYWSNIWNTGFSSGSAGGGFTNFTENFLKNALAQ